MTTLCFGTVFTLLCGNRKNWDKMGKPDVSNRVLYFALLDIIDKHANPSYHLDKAKSGLVSEYTNGTVSSAKLCKKNDHPIQREGNRKNFIERIENDYYAVLNDFINFINEFLDENQLERLALSLIELIDGSNINESDFIYIGNNIDDYYTKAIITDNRHGYNLPSLLAWSLFYIINENIPNGSDEAKATIGEWKKNYTQAPKCPSGESLGRDFRPNLTYGLPGRLTMDNNKDNCQDNLETYLTDADMEAAPEKTTPDYTNLRAKQRKFIYIALGLSIVVLLFFIAQSALSNVTAPSAFIDETGAAHETEYTQRESLPETIDTDVPSLRSNPGEPDPAGYKESDFVPSLSEKQRKQFPLYTPERDPSVLDYDAAKAICQTSIYPINATLPIVAPNKNLNSDACYASLAQTNEWHDTIVNAYMTGEKNTDQTINELMQLIAQQVDAYDYAEEKLGGIGQGLLILIARNYFELGVLYEENAEYELAFTNYIKSIEKYVLCYQILIREDGWNEERIQKTYNIDYWIASVFSYIGDIGDVRRSFRASSFVSSRSFYDFFQDKANSPSKEFYAHSIYFAGHSAYKTALALMEDNPETAINYAKSAKDYYAAYKDLDINLQDKQFVSYCVQAIAQLNKLCATLEQDIAAAKIER